MRVVTRAPAAPRRTIWKKSSVSMREEHEAVRHGGDLPGRPAPDDGAGMDVEGDRHRVTVEFAREVAGAVDDGPVALGWLRASHRKLDR